jgi:membrane protease YdiL (CAAX protease family)
VEELQTPSDAGPMADVIARPVRLDYATVPRPDVSPLRLENVARGAAGLWLLVVAALILPLPIVLQIVVFGNSAEPPTAWQIVIGKTIEMMIVGAVALLLLRAHRLPPSSLGISPANPLRQLALAIPTLVAVYVVFVTTVLLLAFSPLGPGLEEEAQSRREFLNMLPIHDTFMSMLLLAPVAVHEELLFRGLLIPVLRRVSGSWLVSVVIASAIFGALHIDQGPVAIAQIFAVGVTFAVAFLLTRSLLAVIVAHYLFDFLQFQLARVLLPALDAAAGSAT